MLPLFFSIIEIRMGMGKNGNEREKKREEAGMASSFFFFIKFLLGVDND